MDIYIYIYIYRSEGLPLRDMLSLGEWRMGLGWSGKILPSPPSPSPFVYQVVLVQKVVVVVIVMVLGW